MIMSTQARNELDPYRAWLSVKQVRRPLTAYQLLGLEELEDDVQTIRAAAGVQRMAIEAHRHEAPPAVWDQVRGELESAIDVLLDPDRKAIYDAALQTRGDDRVPGYEAPVGMTESDPASHISCPQCNRPNPAGRRFCAGCGTNLWNTCCECGSLSLAADRYCGACGARLAGGVEERAERLEAALAEAEQLRREGRYEEAIAKLEVIAKAGNSRFQRFASRARELAQACRVERQTRGAEAERALEEAERLLADHAYEAALRLLEKIPEGLRSEQTVVLVEEARARLEEIASLDDELASAIASEGTLHLLPKVARLLTLQPDHARARDLAERYRDRACRAAEARIAKRQYRAARDLLATLPGVARNDQVEALARRASEIVWLSDDLRTAPLVDATLVEVAQRLHALAPDDPRVAKLLAEVRRREKIGAVDPRRAYPPWAAAPEKTALGYPVDWLTCFRRIHVREDLAKTVLVDHPGHLYVACGLALQALELAPIRLNLFPREGQTRLGRIAGLLNEDPLTWVSRKRLPPSAWGLDLSTSGLKAVRLVSQGETGDVAVDRVDVLAHRKALGEALNEEEAQTLVEDTVKTFCQRNQIKGDRLCLGLTGRMVLSQRFAMPVLDPERREKVIVYEARHRVPVPLDEAAWGYEVTGRRESEKSGKEDEVLLVAARKSPLLAHLAMLRKLGLRIDVVQCDFLALHNFVVYDRLGREPSKGDGRTGSVALVDVGSDQTNLVVSSPTSVWHRSSRLGGEQLTRALVREFQLTVAQAEALKRRPARAESLERMYHALEPPLETLVADVRSMLDAFAAAQPRQPIDRLLACGGTLQLHGVLRYLRVGGWR